MIMRKSQVTKAFREIIRPRLENIIWANMKDERYDKDWLRQATSDDIAAEITELEETARHIDKVTFGRISWADACVDSIARLIIHIAFRDMVEATSPDTIFSRYYGEFKAVWEGGGDFLPDPNKKKTLKTALGRDLDDIVLAAFRRFNRPPIYKEELLSPESPWRVWSRDQAVTQKIGQSVGGKTGKENKGEVSSRSYVF